MTESLLSYHGQLTTRDCKRHIAHPFAVPPDSSQIDVRLAAVDQVVAFRELPPGTAQDHAGILEAIKKRDIKLARDRIVAHHWNFEDRMRKAV